MIAVMDLIHSLDAVMLQQTGDLQTAVRIALETVSDPQNLLFIFLATLLGLVAGMIPGMGGPVTLSLLIPLTFRLEANVALMILAANLGGTAFGGSMTGILFNMPGDAPNAATVLDGYPLAQQGRAAEAIGASAISSMLGAVVGVLLFISAFPAINWLSTLFFSVDIFWLAVLGLSAIAVIARGSIFGNFIAGLFGLLIAFHGRSAVTGGTRFTWDTTYLLGGVPLIPTLIGLFAIGEMIKLMGERTSIAGGTEVGSGILTGVKSVFQNWRIFLQSSIFGWLIGVVPGAGGTVANFLAYLQAQQTSDNPESFGTGNIKGVIASEAANDAKDGGSLVPTLGLGIPGSASMAVLIGGFIINGVTPGPLLFRENLQIVFIILFALVISNVVTSLIGLLIGPYLTKLTRIPIMNIAPVIVVIALIGSYLARSNFGDVLLVVGAGILGLFFEKFDMSRIAFVLALVLGPIAEQNFQRALQISGGDPSVLVQRPLSIILLGIIVFIWALPLYRDLRSRLSGRARPD